MVRNRALFSGLQANLQAVLQGHFPHGRKHRTQYGANEQREPVPSEDQSVARRNGVFGATPDPSRSSDRADSLHLSWIDEELGRARRVFEIALEQEEEAGQRKKEDFGNHFRGKPHVRVPDL